MSLHARIHFLNFARKLAVVSIFFLIPLHFLSLGFSGGQIGLIISCFALAPLLISLPTGWINDRFSMTGIIRGSLFAAILLLLLLAWAQSFILVAALFMLLGMANNALDVSLNSLYFKDETAMDQNRKYGTYSFWMGFGPAVGVFAGGFLTKFGNFRVLFIAFALILLFTLFTVRKFDHEKFHVVSFRDYRRNLLRKKTVLFAVFIFILALHWSVEGTVYSPFLQKNLGLEGIQISSYIAAGMMLLSISAFLVGLKKFDARINKRMLLLAMGLSGGGMALMTIPNPWVSFAFRAVHEIGDGFLGALITVTVCRLFEKKSIGGSAGALLAVQVTAQMVGALVFAPLGFRLGLQYPFLICGALLIANAFYGLLIFRRAEY